MLDELNNDTTWRNFFNNKIDKGHINKLEQKKLEDYINNRKYLEITSNIHSYEFSYPKKVQISKVGKLKKRIVYCYSESENYILKIIAYKLYKYDYIFPNNLYSYRKTIGVKNAIYKLSKNKNINKMYAYKVDISNYFNSINIDILLPKLKEIFYDDKDLYVFFKNILLNPYVIENEKIIKEKKGIMGGVPISSFLANVYLMEMDKYFYDNNILYFRYADDIIIFSRNENDLNKYIKIIKEYLNKYELKINIFSVK